MTKKQLNVRETWEILNSGNTALGIYDVSIIQTDAGGVVGYNKVMRTTAPGTPVWSCGHMHATWNDAAACTATAMAGDGEALPPREG